MKISRLMVLSVATSAGFLALALAYSQAGNSFRAIGLAGDNERVTGMYCMSVKSCVIATEVFGGAGHLYATDGQKITSTILTGDEKLAASLGTIGEIGFLGFSKVGNQLIAQVNGAGASFVSASGDFSKATSWSALKIGSVSGEGTFGLNQQMGFGQKDDRWVSFTFRMIYDSTDAPSPGALWSPLWSPVEPSIPSNFADLKKAEPALCDSDPGVSISPHLTQAAYVAPNLSLILYPAGARNQRGSDTPGVCISSDGGKRFYHVAFPDIHDDLGPLGVTCITANRCFAYGGVDNAPESAFVYFSNDALKGKDSSWSKAKLPTLREDSKFRSVFFAPDGLNGWLVGSSESSSPLLFSSTDGGASWKDVTSSIRALAQGARLHSGYAFDATHVWVGGEHNTLLTLGN